jgi:hypothetical protein
LTHAPKKMKRPPRRTADEQPDMSHIRCLQSRGPRCIGQRMLSDLRTGRPKAWRSGPALSGPPIPPSTGCG